MAGPKAMPKKAEIVNQVAERIRGSDNVLVALSKDPSVDELSAALGLTFMLDKIGKHATAIFSGKIPNAIEFLEPEKTFEANTDSLQDFIIALDKEKADHLRYKIDGDYVKVFITPYKTTISEADMEFSHGEYNVDLVISLNVSSVDDLDRALSEYGRIMHDATSINISANNQGKFGDLEWGDAGYSSVSEMVFELASVIKEDDSIVDKSVATALLAGIVAATNRFSNERTTSGTMSAAAKLMAAGADQQLISSSIPVEILTENVVDANADFAAEVDAKPVPAAPAQSAPKEGPAPELSELMAASEEAPKVEAKIDTQASTEAKSENVSAPESTPAQAPAPVESDPTRLAVHHGAVAFDPNEDLPAEERAKIQAEKDRIAAEKAAEDAKLLEQHAPIDALIAEINAKNGVTDPLATPAPISAPTPASVSAPAPEAPVAPASVQSAQPSAPAGGFISDLKDEQGDDRGIGDPSAHIGLDAGEKKKLMPLGEVLNRPEQQKDYASMMSAELASPDLPPNPGMVAAPAVNQYPEPNYANPMPPMMAPTGPGMPPLNNPTAAEYVDPATVATNPILPPPPAPFTGGMNQYMPPAGMPPIPMPPMAPAAPMGPAPMASTPMPAEAPAPAGPPMGAVSMEDMMGSAAPVQPNGPSASDLASSIQANNPVVQNTPNMDAGEGGYPPVNAPVMPGVTVSVGAPTLQAMPNPGQAPAPAPAPAVEDASAFHIPGM